MTVTRPFGKWSFAGRTMGRHYVLATAEVKVEVSFREKALCHASRPLPGGRQQSFRRPAAMNPTQQGTIVETRRLRPLHNGTGHPADRDEPVRASVALLSGAGGPLHVTLAAGGLTLGATAAPVAAVVINTVQ